MNYKKARDLLDLNDKFNSKDIKKAYYKKALLYHPDKNPDGESMFKQINEAYIYLQNNFDSDTKRENLSFFYFLNNFILPNGEINKPLINQSLQNLMKNYEKNIIKIFQKMNKENSISIYKFVCKHSDILSISVDILKDMKSILHKKMISDNIIILNPSIDDLLNDKIYKLEFNNRMFYIPLWHNEISYDISDNDLIVKCIPELKPELSIDNNNNIYYKVYSTIQKVFEERNITIKLAENKQWNIPSQKLCITPHQIYTLEEQGLFCINNNNIYDTKKRAHIYIELYLS